MALEGTMSGYALHIHQLTTETIAEYNIGLDLGHHDPRNCVAIFGEDMASCLAAVVDLGADDEHPTLIWSDADGDGTPIKDQLARGWGQPVSEFAFSVSVVLKALFPHLNEDVPA